MKTYVLYHANCTDGAGAALAAFIAMGDTATYIPAQYGMPVPDMPGASIIYLLDFSYPEDILVKLAETAQVFVIDHHKTARDTLEHINHPSIAVKFDMDQSGATMAWKYFHPDRTVPKLLRHIEDRDLWRFKMEGSHEIHRGLGQYPDWHDWAPFLFDPEPLVKPGAAIIKYLDVQIDRIIGHPPVKSPFTDDVVPMYNLPGFLISDALHAALEKFPECPYAIGYIDTHNRVIYSLRSRGDYDTTTISTQYGGGGHASASGFKVMK